MTPRKRPLDTILRTNNPERTRRGGVVMSETMRAEKFDCPHCGQDLRLSPTARADLRKARAQVREVKWVARRLELGPDLKEGAVTCSCCLSAAEMIRTALEKKR